MASRESKAMPAGGLPVPEPAAPEIAVRAPVVVLVPKYCWRVSGWLRFVFSRSR